ncbi:MAG: TonB-dependent receptor domain-containing protein [Candidatus Sulfotelmatobacter sp.]
MARCWLLLSLFGLFLTTTVYASGPTGTITGTVTDPSGAVVRKTRITVLNKATNAVRDAETNDDGDYTVALLPPGRYQVTAESAGFRKSIFSEVTVDVDQTVRVDFALVIGTASEEVRVKDTPPAIQTDTSTLGQVVNNRLVQELPLNERNFLSFALLVPGSQLPAEGSENSTEGGSLSVNGAREQSNNFLLDGVDNNDPYINQYVALPSVDAIQEFKVESSDYSAEYGRGGGAQINVVLKSGTNAFHGTLFEYFRNRSMDAKNYFDFPYCTANSATGTCGGVPALQRNQFGGTLGGPIAKDRTFFFISYEGLRLRQAETREATVPSQNQWNSVDTPMNPILAILPGFAHCPSASDPSCQSGLNVRALYPAANVGDPDSSNAYLSAPVIRQSENYYSAKLDHHFSSVDSLSAHYSLVDNNIFSPFDPVNAFSSLPGYGSYTLGHGQNAGLEWTRVFHSRLLNELRLGFIRNRFTVLQQNHGTDYNTALGFPEGLTNAVDLGYPDISVTGFDGIGEPVNYPQDRHDTTLQVVDNVAWTVGRNQFKIGADVHHLRLDNYIDFLARGEWLYLGYVGQGAAQAFCHGSTTSPGCDPTTYSLSELLAAIPDAATLGGVPNPGSTTKGNTFNSLRSYGVSAYVQDDIHVVPRFLLNVGLRYEYTNPPVEALNRFSVPDLVPCPTPCTTPPPATFIQAGTNGVPRATYSPTYTDFGPRIGIAWRPLKTERWVVRSAYGIFYDSSIAQINVFPRINPPYYNLGLYQQNANAPPLWTPQTILLQTGSVPQNDMISPNFRDGYMQQWNLDLQYEVLPDWMVDAAYVGSKGTHLADVIDRNEQDPITGAFLYPQFASILFVGADANSSYNSLQLRSEKRTRSGLSLLLSYTYSKSFDDISSVFGGSVGSGLPQNSNDLSADRGPSDFNAVNRFSGSFVYDLPLHKLWAHGPGWSGRLLNNWQASGIVTAQTGSPFTVVLAGGTSSADAAFGNPARPDLIANPFLPGPVAANPSCAAPSQVKVPQSWINPCAFVNPPGGAAQGTFLYGSEGRNALTGPGFTNIDFGLAKSMALGSENHHLMLRGDFFNLLNHPNFDIPGHVFDCQPCSIPYGGASFGKVLSANSYGDKPPRQIQLSMRYVF